MQSIKDLKHKDIFFDFSGRAYIVAGASSGIGAEIASLLCEAGASILLLGKRSEVNLPSKIKKILSNKIWYRQIDFCDVESSTVLCDFASDFVSQCGKLDGLVNTVGLHYFSPIRTTSKLDIQKILSVNIGSVYDLLKIFTKKNMHVSGSSIVLFSSTAGFIGEACTSLYALSKASISSLAKSLAAELINKNIRVNCIVPSIVKTGMTNDLLLSLAKSQVECLRKSHPMGFGNTLDVANTAAFLLSSGAAWINGTSLICDGGYLNLKSYD